MKRLLLISYYFPPSGGPGVQRTLKFAKYLGEFGWEPTILTVDPRMAAYPSIDRSLEIDVPEHLSVVRTRSWDPYGLYATLTGRKKGDAVSVSFSGEAKPNLRQRTGRWIRANLFLPDARVGWVPFAIRAARRLADRGSFDAMMTTGPPHSTHLVGLRIARSHGIPWLADFRDPWTAIDFSHLLPTSSPARRLDRSLERRVLSEAGRVSIVTPSLVSHLRALHERHYDVIMNGFDPSDFERVDREVTGEFRLSHIGSMDVSRDPEALWQALAKPELDQVQAELVGRVDPLVTESAARYIEPDRVCILSHVEHSDAVDLMCRSPLLLLVINRAELAGGIAPGKMFEYVGSGRPVLGIGPVDGDAATVLRTSGAGEMFDYGDVDGIARFVRRLQEVWASGRPLQGSGAEQAEQYSRRHRTRQLATVLDELSERGAADESL